jgi:TRAP-type C4-dicarboxylate transport system permease small subunit
MTRLVAFGRFLLGTLMLTAVAINFSNVVGRYAFAKPIFWAEEAMVFIQVWCVLIGAALITQAHKHLRMDAIASLAPPGVRRILDLITMGIMASIGFLIAAVSALVVFGMIESDQRSVALEIPMALPYAALPIGFFLIALLALLRFWRLLRNGAAASRADESGLGG